MEKIEMVIKRMRWRAIQFDRSLAWEWVPGPSHTLGFEGFLECSLMC